MKKLFCLFALVSFLISYHSQNLQASHLIGGELSYRCVGGNTFEVNLTIYRDCYCVDCAFFDDPANITVFNSSGGVETTFGMFDPDIVDVVPNTEGLCLETIPDVCVERGTYSTLVDLPPIPGGYQIVHQRCCRNNTIQNIEVESAGSTYVATIPEQGFAACDNSSPTFDDFPPIIICANSPLIFDHSATDADGDVLVYEICEPVLGASSGSPAPSTASSPPYPPVNYLSGYSYDNPFGSSVPLEINPITGLLTGFPEVVGQFVVGVCVSEYRGGVLIGTNRRDFQFNVSDCAIILAQISLRGDNTLCEGESTSLDGYVFGEDEWFWTPTNGLSNPNSLSPEVTVNETTTFVLTAQNFSGSCLNTDSITVYVAAPVTANAGNDEYICSEPVQLQGSGGELYFWSPSDGLSSTDICCPMANPAVTTTYTLVVGDATGSCIDMDEMTVVVSPTSSSVVLQLKAVLEGAYDATTGMMRTTLNEYDLIPLNQPYNRTPWDYGGQESVSSLSAIPANVVDWVLVEIRNGADDSEILASRAAFLLNDGSVVDIDGVTNGINICGLESGVEYYVVLRHRNHLAVMSTAPIALPNAVPYDFSQGVTQASGTEQMKALSSGIAALYAGDFNSDGVTTVSDFNYFLSEAGALNQYFDSDANLDRAVTIADMNMFQVNAGIIGIVQIRY